jgi:hypothetical protein
MGHIYLGSRNNENRSDAVKDGAMVGRETTVGMEEDDTGVRILMRVYCRLGVH